MATASASGGGAASGFTTADAAADGGMLGGGGAGGGYAPLAAPPPDPVPGRRSLLGQALHDTFGRTGAKVGAVWIGALAVLGIFAPFLANTHPLAMRGGDGRLSFPLFATLGPIDVCLVIYFAFAAFTLARRHRAQEAVLCLLWPLVALGAVILVVRLGPALATFGLYRPAWLAEMSFSGRGVVGWTWFALVNAGALLLALAAIAAAVAYSTIYFRGAGRYRAAAAAAVVALLAMVLVAFAVRTPDNIVYERYREMRKTGEVRWALNTVVPYSPNDRLRDRPQEILNPPSRVHWLGTTQFGEDMLSRMLHACRVALAIGLIATSISVAIGIVVGGLMGYYAGTLDLLGMRVLEIIEAIPTLILLLIITVFFGRSLYLMMVVIGLVTWTSNARFVRAEFLRLRNLDYVQAAVAAGIGRWSIIFRHMLPNGVAPVLVNASFGIAGAILLESVLSFLGLGLGADDPSWGQMLEQARAGGGFNWWIATFPGLAIFLTVFSYILIGEAMRDAIDPKLRKRD